MWRTSNFRIRENLRHMHFLLFSAVHRYPQCIRHICQTIYILQFRSSSNNASIKSFPLPVLGNALWDMRSRKVSTNSRISAITEYSFHLRVCLPLIYAVFFHWNTSFTPFILVSNSINWWVNQFFGYFCLPRKKNAIKLHEFREGCLLAKCFKSVIIPFWFLL